ncbi:MAG: tetratricopeptide repeat protein [Candidatus Glassbacteria bacterium]
MAGRNRTGKSGNRETLRSGAVNRGVAVLLLSRLTLIPCILSLLLCCSRAQEGKTVNLLVITLDTTRADKLGAYGCTEIKTPNIDRLAKSGVLFTRAYSSVPLTLPSHATIMTGMYPPGHGVRNNGNYRLPEGVTTLAELLSEAGYRTAAFLAAFVLDSRFGLDQGFKLYHDSFLNLESKAQTFEYAERDAGRVTELAVDWLKDARSPFFLWVHYFDPHHPYIPPQPYGDKYRDAPYLGEIAYTDHCVGTLLDALKETGLGDRTLIVLTSDHGESLGEHLESSHGVFLYEGPMRVPLIMTLDGVLPAGRRVDDYVSLADILPTVCEVLDINVPDQVQGRSLLDVIRGVEKQETPLYMESRYPVENYGWSEITGLLWQGWKYLRVPEPELYDIEADPHEQRNLAGENHEMLTALDSLLSRTEGHISTAVGAQALHQMDEDARKRLESLGYVWNADGGSTEEEADPKKMIGIMSETERGMVLFSEGNTEEAARVFEGILELDPGNITAHNLLGLILYKLGEPEEAMLHWKRVIKLNPGYVETYRNLGSVLRKMGRLEEARDAFLEAVRLNPDYTEAYVELGVTYKRMGRDLEAREQFLKALELDPDFLQSHLFFGNLLKDAGQLDSALVHYRHVLSIDSSHTEARRQAAKILMRKGDFKGALEHFKYVADVIGDLESYIELGIAYDRAGMGEEAVEVYRKAVAIDSLSSRVYNNLGIALFRLERFEEAKTNLRKAVSLKEDYAEAYFNLGNVYRKLGRTEEALQSYKSFLKLRRGNEEAAGRARELIRQLEGGN